MPATHPDANTRMRNLQEDAEIDRFRRELEIARMLCEHCTSPDTEWRFMQAWNAYADHVGLPKAARPEPASPASLTSSVPC
jgi:hypothetical protein